MDLNNSTVTTVDITPKNWGPISNPVPGQNLWDSGCVPGGDCGGSPNNAHKQVTIPTAGGCGTYGCKCLGDLCSQCQNNKSECAPDDSGINAITNAQAMCPAIGSATSFRYSAGVGGSWGTAITGVKIRCTYNYINPATLWSDADMNTNFSAGTRDIARAAACSALNSVSDLSDKKIQCIDAWGAATGQTQYESKMLTLCSNFGDWTTLTSCMNVVTSVIQTGSTNSNFSSAQAMARTYCAIPANQTKDICGCHNAFYLGFYNKTNQTANCFTTANRGLPGCKDVIKATQDIVSLGNAALQTAFQGVQTDSGHFTQLCDTAERNANGGGILPYESAASFATASIITNICHQSYTAAIDLGVVVSQKCDIVNNVNINTGGPTPPHSPSPPSPSSSSPSSSSSSSLSPKNNNKIAIEIGGCIASLIMCCFCLLIIVIATMK